MLDLNLTKPSSLTVISNCLVNSIPRFVLIVDRLLILKINIHYNIYNNNNKSLLRYLESSSHEETTRLSTIATPFILYPLSCTLYLVPFTHGKAQYDERYVFYAQFATHNKGNEVASTTSNAAVLFNREQQCCIFLEYY